MRLPHVDKLTPVRHGVALWCTSMPRGKRVSRQVLVLNQRLNKVELYYIYSPTKIVYIMIRCIDQVGS